MTYSTISSRVALLALAGAALAGCFTVDAKLETDESATMTIVYPFTADSTVEAERKRVQSSDVIVESAEVAKGHATMKLKLPDVRKTKSSDLFTNVTITVDEKDGTTNVVAKVVPDEVWRNIPDKGFEVLGQEVRISVEVPGTVVETNAQERKPNAVTWKMPSKQFFRTKQTELQLSYKPGNAAAPATSMPPTTAPAAKPTPPTKS